MTVVYNAEVATVTFSGFLKLLIRWRGSIYKLLWKDFLLFAGIYAALALLFNYGLKGIHQERFKEMVEYCNKYQEKIPLSFILGFYVNTVIGRWWEQFNSIPWPSRLAVMVTSHIRGQDDRSRMIRRTIIRYVCLGYVMTMSCISIPVKQRFPTINHIVDAGFMLPNEQEIIDMLKTPYSKYYIPFVWATTLVSHARREGRVSNDYAFQTLVDEINAFRGKAQKLFNYDWVTIPLVYTQVATLAVYTFFLASLMGRQYIQGSETGDLVFPFFTMLQFFFYMGWLKVAEELMNPFGEDDDDFDINSLIDRNLKTGYLIVDEMHEDLPELIKDQYWDTLKIQIPYTEAAMEYYKSAPIGSAENIDVPVAQQQFLPETSSQLSLIKEVDESEITSLASSKSGGSGRRLGFSKMGAGPPPKKTPGHYAKTAPTETEIEIKPTASKTKSKTTFRDKILNHRNSVRKMAKAKEVEKFKKYAEPKPPSSRKDSKTGQLESEFKGRKASVGPIDSTERISPVESFGSKDSVSRLASPEPPSRRESLKQLSRQGSAGQEGRRGLVVPGTSSPRAEADSDEAETRPKVSQLLIEQVLNRLQEIRSLHSTTSKTEL